MLPNSLFQLLPIIALDDRRIHIDSRDLDPHSLRRAGRGDGQVCDRLYQRKQMGRNFGGISRSRAALRERLADIHATTGRKVSLVGWSLGGVYARDLALHAPEMVRYVLTLGSPFANDVRATNATRLYELLSGETVGDDPELVEAIAGDLPMPATSIFSRADGVVNWRTCLLRPSAAAENIEVYLASHVGLGVNPAVLWAVADRLAQHEGHFSQFDRSGPFAIAYAPPERAQS